MAKNPPPPESFMLPLVLVVGAIAATIIAIPCAMSTPSPGGSGWLPWALLALGVGGMAFAIFEKNPKFDPKLSAQANMFVVFFGPVGARIGYAIVGGAFLGGGIGLLLC
jgi:hypothetical protein